MTLAVFLAVYAGALLFLIGCCARAIQYRRTPMHLRWELYPVPHEAPRHARHGGSYFEESHWWSSRQTNHQSSALIAMGREIFLLKGLWEFNRSLWPPSFLFHFGLYLTIATIVLHFAAAALGAGAAAALLASVSHWIGWAGILFVVLGAVWLLKRRMFDPRLANYTRPADVFNLFFFLIAFLLVADGLSRTHAMGSSLFTVVHGLFRFDRATQIDPVLASGIVLSSALAAYIPFTHMSHFIAKYFTWHEVRWDDRRNVRGSRIERTLAENLQLKPTWSAAHVQADGDRTWAEIATTNPAQEKRP
ncbi:MAG: respiratory nitrate reductase subunit gamma [Acidobacteriota bacterium]